MSLRFSKMHSLGNDFVVIDAISHPVHLSAGIARHIANRKLGIGCDQILLVEAPANGASEFMFRIYNADGSESGQCGNGARCFARFVRDNGLTSNEKIVVDTSSDTRMTLTLNDDNTVTVDMGAPRLAPADVPFKAAGRQVTYDINVDDAVLSFGVVSMGNPHAVMIVDDVESAPVDSIGPSVEHHERFPERANVGFMEIVSRDHIRLRVHERGVGETQACGSGACAAVVSGRLRGLLNDHVDVDLPGGRVSVGFAGEAQPVFLRGDAVHVYDGELDTHGYDS